MNIPILIYRLEGGIGDYVSLTGYIKKRKEKEKKRKIYIILGRGEILDNNPHIQKIIVVKNDKVKKILWKLFRVLNKLKLPVYDFIYKRVDGKTYEEFVIENPNLNYTEVLSRHISKELLLKNLKNEIFFSDKEIILFEEKFKKLPKDYMLIHSEGDKITYTANKEIGSEKFQKIVNENLEKKWIQIGKKNNIKLKNTLDFRGKTDSLRELFYLISKAKGIVCQEGGYAHISNCFNVPTIVIYTGFNRKNFCSYENTYEVQNPNLPLCSPCLMRENCPYEMKCNDYDIVKNVNLMLKKIENQEKK